MIRFTGGNTEITFGKYTIIIRSEVFYVLLIITLAAVYFRIAMWPNFQRARSAGMINRCSSNCRDLGEALNRYREEKGRFPESLAKLVPDYIKEIPKCPAARKDTYSSTYSVSENGDVFTFYCQGLNHQDVGINKSGYPRYTSAEGFITRPPYEKNYD